MGVLVPGLQAVVAHRRRVHNIDSIAILYTLGNLLCGREGVFLAVANVPKNPVLPAVTDVGVLDAAKKPVKSEDEALLGVRCHSSLDVGELKLDVVDFGGDVLIGGKDKDRLRCRFQIRRHGRNDMGHFPSC